MAPIFKNGNSTLLRTTFHDLVEVQHWFEEETDNNPELYTKHGPVDQRDVGMFVMLLHFDDPKWMNLQMTREEYLAELHKVYDQLSTDPMPLVNQFYDHVEKYTFTGQENATKAEITQALIFVRLNQLIGKMPNDAPEVVEQRYHSSLKGMQLYDAIDSRSTASVTPVLNELDSYGLDANRGTMTDPKNVAEPDFEEAEFSVFYKQNEDNTENFEEYLNVMMGKKNVFDYKVPEFVGYFEEMVKSTKDPQTPCDPRYKGEPDYGDFAESFFNTVLPHNTYARNFYKLAYDTDHNALARNIYIDGRPLTEGLTYDTNNGKAFKQQISVRLARAINEGKAIDLLCAYDVNGQVTNKIVSVHPTYSKGYLQKVQDDYCEKNNIGWWHRHVFNWGPWKIQYPDPLGDANRANLSNEAARHVAIERDAEKNLTPLYNKKKVEREMKVIRDQKEAARKREVYQTKQLFEALPDVEEADKAFEEYKEVQENKKAFENLPQENGEEEAKEFLKQQKEKEFNEAAQDLGQAADAYMENPNRRPLDPAEAQDIHEMVENPEEYFNDPLNKSFIDEDTVGIKDPDNEVIEK